MNQPMKIYVGGQPLNLDQSAACEIETVPFKETVPIRMFHCPTLHDGQFADEGCANDMPGLHRTCTIEMENVNPLFRRKKPYPRKLKKAVGQICSIKERRDGVSVAIHLRQKTKWQRKAFRMVEVKDNTITVPTTSGFTMTLEMKR